MIKIKLSTIKSAAYLVLTLPILLFLFGWVKLIIAIPAAALMIAAYVFIIMQTRKEEDVFEISKASLITIGVLMLLWCYISGHGGFFYQSNDHHWRNAIFRDLINFDWPVVYEYSGSMLVYYIGFWLVPALIGKITALISPEAARGVANAAMFLWSFIFLFLTTLLVCAFTKAKSFSRVLLTVFIIIFFSGMDIVGVLAANKWDPDAVSDHLEWWGKHYQYSSNSTQLFWVFNQSTPAWLATALFLNEKSVRNYVFLCLALLPCSPFPMVGLFLLLVVSVFRCFFTAIKEKTLPKFLLEAFSLQNIIAAVVVLPVFYLYYKGNMAIDSGGFRFWLGFDRYEPSQALYFYARFAFLEFGLLAALLFWRFRKNLLYWVSVLSLCFIGMFRMGGFADFSMRASIPALFVLMVLAISMLQNGIGSQKTDFGIRYTFSRTSIAILLVLIIGAVTPLVECFRAINAVQLYGVKGAVADDIITFSDKPVKDYKNFMTAEYKSSDFWRYLRD